MTRGEQKQNPAAAKAAHEHEFHDPCAAFTGYTAAEKAALEVVRLAAIARLEKQELAR